MTYRIKPLVWRHCDEQWWTNTEFGQYVVCRDAYPPHCGSWVWIVGGLKTPCDSAEAGEAAVEAHYLSRLLPALEEVTT